MNRRVVLVLLAAMCMPAVSASAAPPAAISKEDLAALIKRVEASAKSWAEQDQEDQDIDAPFAKIQYDDSSIPLLVNAIGAGRKDPQGLYVTVKLLDPLVVGRNDLVLSQIVNLQSVPSWATPEMINKLLPTIKSADARMGKYLPMPNYTKEVLKNFEIPDYSAQNISEAAVRALEQINKLRIDKQNKEKPIARHDLLAWQLHRIMYRLMITLNDPKEDQAIIKAIYDSETAGTADFVYLIFLVDQAAPSMTPDRAKKYYEELVKLAVTLRWKWHGYANYGAIVIRPDANSDPQAVQTSSGIELASVCNALALKCSAPKINAPSEADVRKVQTFVYEWRRDHSTPPGALPSDAEVQQWLEGQKNKPSPKPGKKGG